MSKKIILFIVVILGILIFLAFLALFYGIYLKISIASNNSSITNQIILSDLSENEKIIDIEVIDKNRLLVILENSDNIKGAIYDINKKKITAIIDRWLKYNNIIMNKK